jgi:hypothetical protein
MLRGMGENMYSAESNMYYRLEIDDIAKNINRAFFRLWDRGRALYLGGGGRGGGGVYARSVVTQLCRLSNHVVNNSSL